MRRTARRTAAALAALAIAFGVAAPAAPARADAVRDKERWVLAAVGAQRAWGVTKGHGATVGVLDTGVDAGHPDLSGSVRAGPDLIKDIAVEPHRLHGTYMASLIAGHGHGAGGGSGVMGIAPEAKVLSVRTIADDDEPGYDSFRHSQAYQNAFPKSVRYAVDHGVDVINLSLGGPHAARADRDAIAYAISKGVVVVAAAGNDGASKDPHELDGDGITRLSYPAAFPGVVAVAAVGKSGKTAKFSDRNASVVVAAPGAGVVGAGPDDAYFLGDGTSQACAIVSGVAALIRAEHPRMAPALVAQALTASARGRPAAGYDESVGFGEVDAAAALSQAARLDGYRAAGAPEGGRFGHDPVKPIQVVRHPAGLVFLGGWVGVAALFGLIGALALTVLLIRRTRADRTGGGTALGASRNAGGEPGPGRAP